MRLIANFTPLRSMTAAGLALVSATVTAPLHAETSLRPSRLPSPPVALPEPDLSATTAQDPNGPSPIRGLNNAGFAKLKADWLRVSAGYRYRLIGANHSDERTDQFVEAIVAEDPNNVATEFETDKRTQPFWDKIRDDVLGKLSAEESAKIPSLKQRIVEAYEERRAEQFTKTFAKIFEKKYDPKAAYEKAEGAAKQLGRRQALATIGAAEKMAVNGQKFVASDTTTVESSLAWKKYLDAKEGSEAEKVALKKFKQLRLRQKDVAADMVELSNQLNGSVTASGGRNHVVGRLEGEESTMREHLPEGDTLACAVVDRQITEDSIRKEVEAGGVTYHRGNCFISFDPENPGVFVTKPGANISDGSKPEGPGR